MYKIFFHPDKSSLTPCDSFVAAAPTTTAPTTTTPAPTTTTPAPTTTTPAPTTTTPAPTTTTPAPTTTTPAPTTTTPKPYYSCPAGFTMYRNVCFHFATAKKTWYDASKACRGMNSRASLARPTTWQINYFIISKYKMMLLLYNQYYTRDKATDLIILCVYIIHVCLIALNSSYTRN